MSRSITIELGEAAWTELKAAADACGLAPEQLAAARLREAALFGEEDLAIDEAKLGPLLDEAEAEADRGEFASQDSVRETFAKYGVPWP